MKFSRVHIFNFGPSPLQFLDPPLGRGKERERGSGGYRGREDRGEGGIQGVRGGGGGGGGG